MAFFFAENDGSSTTESDQRCQRRSRKGITVLGKYWPQLRLRRDRGVATLFQEECTVAFHSPLNERDSRRTTTPSLVIEEFLVDMLLYDRFWN
jgi:hypothetical protein